MKNYDWKIANNRYIYLILHEETSSVVERFSMVKL